MTRYDPSPEGFIRTQQDVTELLRLFDGSPAAVNRMATVIGMYDREEAQQLLFAMLLMFVSIPLVGGAAGESVQDVAEHIAELRRGLLQERHRLAAERAELEGRIARLEHEFKDDRKDDRDE